MVALPPNVARKHVMEMLLTGDMISAARAAEIGLINKSVPEGALRDVTREMARRIASKSSITLATGKRAFYAQSEMTLPDAYDYASKVMVENLLARDAPEGIGAFIENRAPKWTNS
jgi:enoyl-CoA hydratase/carnithine racemase